MKNNKLHTNAEIIKLIEAIDLLHKELIISKKVQLRLYAKINRLK